VCEREREREGGREGERERERESKGTPPVTSLESFSVIGVSARGLKEKAK